MAQLIEIDITRTAPGKLRINSGDVLLFKATGDYLESGEGVVEVLGSFTPGLLLASGEKISAQGTPGTVMVRALQQGTAQITIVRGGPWGTRSESLYELEVEP